VPIKRRVSLPVLSLSDQRLQRRLRAKGGVFAFAPTTNSTMSRRADPTNRVMMDCIIYLSPPSIKQTFDLHHVVYLIHNYLNHIFLTPIIYTDLESIRPRLEKKRSTSTRKDITVKANLEMNQDLNILDKVFSLT
jgi:hypothetical protein